MAGTRALGADLVGLQLDAQQARVLVSIAATAGTLYYTDQAVPVAYGGNTYQPRGIVLGDILHGGMGDTELELEIDDNDLALYTVALAEGLSDLDCQVVVQVAPQGTAQTGTWTAHYVCTWQILNAGAGQVGGCYRISIGPGIGRNPRHGLSEDDRTCPNIYQTTGRCAVAGATFATYPTCDKTWAACVIRSNTDRNNSARHAPEPGETVVWVTTEGHVTHQAQAAAVRMPAASSASPYSGPDLRNNGGGAPTYRERHRRVGGRYRGIPLGTGTTTTGGSPSS